MQDFKNKIIKYYKENEMKIWVIIIVFVLAILITQTMNQRVKERKNTVATNDTNANNYYREVLENNESIENIENIENTEKKSDPEKEERLYFSLRDEIVKFVRFCNEGRVEDAYEMVSEECKKEYMPTLEDFKNQYYDKIFDSKKSYETKLIMVGENDKTVICIDYFADILSAGKINDEDKITDYIIGIKENGIFKLKLLGYNEYMEMENNK